MQVIHSDADSIHLVSATHTAAVTAIQDRSPRLTVCQRTEGTSVPVWQGTLQQGRSIDARHNHAAIVRHLLKDYVDSGAIDTYRQGQGLTGRQVAGRGRQHSST